MRFKEDFYNKSGKTLAPREVMCYYCIRDS